MPSAGAERTRPARHRHRHRREHAVGQRACEFERRVERVDGGDVRVRPRRLESRARPLPAHRSVPIRRGAAVAPRRRLRVVRRLLWRRQPRGQHQQHQRQTDRAARPHSASLALHFPLAECAHSQQVCVCRFRGMDNTLNVCQVNFTI